MNKQENGINFDDIDEVSEGLMEVAEYLRNRLSAVLEPGADSDEDVDPEDKEDLIRDVEE